MDADAALRIAALCVVLACAETLHGIVRTTVVTPRIGKELAIKLSALTGTVLACLICMALVPGIGLRSPGAHLLLGVGLSVFMAGFDIAIGRLLMRKPWARIWPDFDPRTGNYLAYGLLALSVIPLLVWFITRAAPSAAA
jgi:hypothetical protein